MVSNSSEPVNAKRPSETVWPVSSRHRSARPSVPGLARRFGSHQAILLTMRASLRDVPFTDWPAVLDERLPLSDSLHNQKNSPLGPHGRKGAAGSAFGAPLS